MTDPRRLAEAARGTAPTVVVAALRENLRPVGFAPWPEPEPAATKKRKRSKRSS